MKVIERFHPNNGYGGDPLLHLDLKRYENESHDFYLFLGDAYNDVFSKEYYDKPRYFLSLEEPNFCMQRDSWHEHLTLGKNGSLPPEVVLTLCPYTIDSLKDINNNRHLTFFPFNENYSYDNKKEYDIIYSGSQPPIYFWNDIFSEAKKRNLSYAYCYYSPSQYTTHHSLSYKEKMILYSKSKISICHGIFNAWGGRKHLEFIGSENNRAFDAIRDGQNIGPQVKSRTFESAFSKTLILMYHDQWNVSERFFKPDRDFLYFSSLQELFDIIDDFKSNETKYSSIIESAYNVAVNNYTTKHFMNMVNSLWKT
jgi:hypothetical protein